MCSPSLYSLFSPSLSRCSPYFNPHCFFTPNATLSQLPHLNAHTLN
jgi:hypothetical protein